MEPAHLPAIDELVALVDSRAADRPHTQLEVAIAVERDLTEMGDALIGRFVMQARTAGLSWTDIGRLFGTTKQAVQQRYGAALTGPGAWPGRWSPAAREALDRVGEEARELGHDYVGTEHALLSLLSAEGSIAAEILSNFGVSRRRMLATSCMQPRPGHTQPHQCMPVMPRFKQALEHSRRIADGLEAPVANTEHLLAGILAVPDSMAVEILRRVKASPEAVRIALAERLGVQPEQLGARRHRRRRLLAGSRD